MSSDLKFISFNARGLRQAKKRRKLFAYFHRQNTDLVFLQESHSSLADAKYWTNEWGGRILFSHGSTNSRGVCILFNPQLSYKIIKEELDPFGRYIFVDIEVQNRFLTLACIYAPNIDSSTFFVDLSNFLDRFHGETIILAGDLNFVFNLEMDKTGGNPRTNFKAREKCLNLMAAYELLDIWRERNPLSKLFTWSSNVTTGIHCRLDYFLVSRSLEHSVKDVLFFTWSAV
ncbi:hypothetical protein HOLleu_22332 [Holothuria leucospilota]|uniref:exodeoxyribonuclease III n=1 Tax=Holothuria leucospilota TaxID=206669 RepID=A0A9Q1H6P5_HOLLE|nr:hypothetical protein HOLleu_22332 [Holothuria leucospilota]